MTIQTEIQPTILSTEGVRVEARTEGSQLILDIFSATGIGEAHVSLDKSPGVVPQLRLHLTGLESLRFSYDNIEIMASIQSYAEHELFEEVIIDQDAAQSITASSPYWLGIAALDEEGRPATDIPLADGYFQVTLPVSFQQSGSDSFAVQWIDFYR